MIWRVWAGNEAFNGIDHFFKHLEEQSYKIQYRVMLSRYRGKTTCYECEGARLRIEATYVKIDNKKVGDQILNIIEEFEDNNSLSESYTIDDFGFGPV